MPKTLKLISLRSLLAALGITAALWSVASHDASAQRARRATAPAAQAAAPSESGAGTVNIQTATSEQLQLLPGIGPAKAAAIVEQRDRRAFRRVEDLMRVRGIGRATFRRLRPLITVEGATTLTSHARAARPSEADSEEADAAEE